MIYILLLLFILLPCLPFRQKNPYNEVYETYDKCNYTLLVPRKIINPYREAIANFVPQKPFGSFYLKCAACLAVANQISRIIDNSRQPEKRQICDSLGRNISNEINKLCAHGFKNYDLRKCKEVSVVTNEYRCTEHIKTTMDGGWTKKLREVCSLYTAHMDLEHISNIYANNTEELSTDLCKGTGIFRDCQNLELKLARSSNESCNC